MKWFVFLYLAFVVACGGDEGEPEYTWGEAVSGNIRAFCSRVPGCGLNTSHCFEHSISHMCELDDVCDAPIPEESRAGFAQCSVDILEYDCSLLRWTLPDSCWDTYEEYDPRPM